MRRFQMQAFMVRLRPLCLVLVSLLVGEPLASSVAFSREDITVKNVRFEVSGNKIVIRYDLTGPIDRVYVVKMSVKRRQVPSYEFIPKAVAGDVGEGKFSGSNRQINWEILQELPNGLEGDDYYFRIEAALVPSGSNLVYYLGGAAVVVGAAAYFLLVKKTTTADEGSFPQPAGHPSGY
jgi:hypothetical protein